METINELKLKIVYRFLCFSFFYTTIWKQKISAYIPFLIKIKINKSIYLWNSPNFLNLFVYQIICIIKSVSSFTINIKPTERFEKRNITKNT